MYSRRRIPELEQAVTTAKGPAARAWALIALATNLARTGEAERALVLAEEARVLAASLADRRLGAASLHAVARCHFYLADSMHALELMLEAARSYQEQGELIDAATVLAGVGMCQHRLGAQEDAIASLLRALAAAREHGLAALETNVHNSLGSALLATGRADDAARHLATGVELARTLNDDSLLTKLEQNRALVAMHCGDASDDEAEAIRHYAIGQELAEHALGLARKHANRYDEAHCLGLLGAIQRRRGREREAAAALEATLTLAEQLDEAHVYAATLLELGRLDAARDPERAGQRYGKAIGLAERINARNLVADACAALSALYEQTGDLAAALDHYKRFHAVREAQLNTARQHATRAGQLWIDFQQATRQVTRYREEAKSLAEDKAVLAHQAEALAIAAQQDPLTGLLNRRGFEARIGELVAASDAEGTPLTFALIDIDRFKTVNDTCSHQVGDIVLRRVGKMLRAHCRPVDLTIRYGGDEFLLVFAGADTVEAGLALHRLKASIDACPWAAHAPGLSVTLSIGLAGRPRGSPIEDAIAAADRALYAAKDGGRNRIVAAPDISAQSQKLAR
jgi:diguanylate cyclase (GGDEF)-like protein